jgi:hypothetical protein
MQSMICSADADHANPTPPHRRLLGLARYPDWQYDYR